MIYVKTVSIIKSEENFVFIVREILLFSRLYTLQISRLVHNAEV